MAAGANNTGRATETFMRVWATGLLIVALPLAGGISAEELGHPQADSVAESEQPLTNEDVLASLEAGLPSAVLAASIATSAARFDVSKDALIALANAGVPADVLTAMIEASARQRATETNFSGTPCETPGIFAERDGGLQATDAAATSRADGQSMAGGIASAALGEVSRGFLPGLPSSMKIIIPEATAALRLAAPRPTFLVCAMQFPLSAGGIPPVAVDLNGLRLVALTVRKRRGERTLKIGRNGIFTGPIYAISKRKLRAFEYDEVKPGVYRIRVVAALAPGEYGFYYDITLGATSMGQFTVPAALAGRIFAFGVDRG